MYYVNFGKGYEKGTESLDGTRKIAVAFMGFKNVVPNPDVSPTVVRVYKAKSMGAYVGKVVYRHQGFWWVTYGSIQELSESGKTKKLMTYNPL